MSVKFTIIFALCIIACMAPMIAAQCTGTIHHRCPVWKIGGFCGTGFYTVAQKQFYCGDMCQPCTAK